MAIELPNDFKEFLRLLNSHQVEYLLIGGYAVGAQNAQRLMHVLREFGFGVTELTEQLFLEENKIVRMGNPPMRIEILTSISGVAFSECFAHRIVDTVDGVEAYLIDLAHLKQNKRASGRYKDLDDLDNLP